MPYTLTNTGYETFHLVNAAGSTIPISQGNRDFQDYLYWLVAGSPTDWTPFNWDD